MWNHDIYPDKTRPSFNDTIEIYNITNVNLQFLVAQSVDFDHFLCYETIDDIDRESEKAHLGKAILFYQSFF